MKMILSLAVIFVLGTSYVKMSAEIIHAETVPYAVAHALTYEGADMRYLFLMVIVLHLNGQHIRSPNLANGLVDAMTAAVVSATSRPVTKAQPVGWGGTARDYAAMERRKVYFGG